MSKVLAYRCDYCTNIVEAEHVFGLLPTVDMYDKLASYPSTKKPEQAEIHYCVFCVRKTVLSILEMEFPRRNDEHAYSLRMKELAYNLRSSTIERYRNFAIVDTNKKGNL